MTEPLRLFWWNKSPNFGDALSRDVVAHVSGRKVEWAAETAAQIFAVGSIMWNVRKGVHKRAPGGEPPVVWGTGCMEPIGTDWVSKAEIAALRGPVTAAVFDRSPALALGDPGLLAAEVVGEVARTDAMGIIPHHSQFGTPEIEALQTFVAGQPDRLRLIDVRSNDAAAVIRAIASCSHVFSQSLHGLIVADAYGIPNGLLRPDAIHRSAWFKFYDYCASVRRKPEPGLTLSDLTALLAKGEPGSITSADAGLVQELCAGLKAAFPDRLKAQ